MMRLPHLREKLRKLDDDLAIDVFTSYALAVSYVERHLAAKIDEDVYVIAEYARLSTELEREAQCLAEKAFP